jgi:hypothetical protein
MNGMLPGQHMNKAFIDGSGGGRPPSRYPTSARAPKRLKIQQFVGDVVSPFATKKFILSRANMDVVST